MFSTFFIFSLGLGKFACFFFSLSLENPELGEERENERVTCLIQNLYLFLKIDPTSD